MAEQRVIVEGTYNNVPLPVSGTLTTTPSGTQNVSITGQTINVAMIPAASTAANTLTAATTAVTGTVYDLTYLSRDYTFVATSSAALTAGVVRLFGSIDNSAFVQIGPDISCTADFTAAVSKAYTGAVNFRYFRADVTTTIAGGTLTVKILGE